MNNNLNKFIFLYTEGYLGKLIFYTKKKNNKKAERLCMKCSLIPNIIAQQMPQSLFQKQRPLILLPPPFEGISQLPGQDHYNGKQTQYTTTLVLQD